MATITSAIKAMDDHDGDITTQITIAKNEYLANMNTIGQYEIVYFVLTEYYTICFYLGKRYGFPSNQWGK